MPNKVYLHPVPYLIAGLPVIAGILANVFNLGPQYTYPFAVLVIALTALNASKGTSHPDWTISVSTQAMGTIVPAIATLNGLLTAVIPVLTGPGAPYHYSSIFVGILTALVIVVGWLAQSLQPVLGTLKLPTASAPASPAIITPRTAPPPPSIPTPTSHSPPPPSPSGPTPSVTM